MRVGLVIYGSLDTLSGGYLYDRKLVDQLSILGHSVDVFSLAFRDYTKHLSDNLDDSWHDNLVSARVDLMLQDELNHPSLLRANMRRRNDAPVVSVVHHLRSSETEHPPLLRRLYLEIERTYLNTVDALLYNSHTTKRSVERLLRQPRLSHVAYPAADHLPDNLPAVDIAELARRSRTPGPLRLLFVGNLIPRKGLHDVLNALGRLPSGFWHLDVVGRMDVDYRYTKKMMEKCHRFPQGAVSFHGRLGDAELVDHYRSHHLLAVPSYEGFGIVYLEAMRFGLPVIASTLGAAREIVTPGENGFLVRPKDTRTLANHIYSLSSNRELLLAMSYAARRRYTQHPTWQRSMAEAASWLSTLPETIS